MDGLPHERDDKIAEWEVALGYLRAISESGETVSVSMTSSSEQTKLDARGVLIEHSSERPPETPLFAFNPTSRQQGGFLSRSAKQFKGGYLTTNDGDSYFTLGIRLDGCMLVVQDTNSL